MIMMMQKCREHRRTISPIGFSVQVCERVSLSKSSRREELAVSLSVDRQIVVGLAALSRCRTYHTTATVSARAGSMYRATAL